jgi:hypothetical protein
MIFLLIGAIAVDAFVRTTYVGVGALIFILILWSLCKQVELGVLLTIVWNLLHILEGSQLFDILNQGSSQELCYSQLPSSGSGHRAYTSCNSNSLICILYTQPHGQELATCTLHTSAVLFRLCIFLSL